MEVVVTASSASAATSRMPPRKSSPGPRPVRGPTRRTQPSGEATTRRSASAPAVAPSSGTATATRAIPAQARAVGRSHWRSRSSTEKTVATAEPSRQASPVSSAAIRRTCQGVAPASRSPASRRSRCTAPIRAHCPRNPSTGTSRSSRLTITPDRVPGSFSRPAA